MWAALADGDSDGDAVDVAGGVVVVVVGFDDDDAVDGDVDG